MWLSRSFFLCFFLRASTSSSLSSYCDNEEAIFACGAGKVIDVQTAIYGRMKKGRCITLTLEGTMGCSENVTDMVDKMCSGKQTCTMEVDESIFDRNTGCHAELDKYLEASYQCINANAPKPTCQRQSISLHTGLTNFIKSPDECTSQQPSVWQLSALPGQTLSLKLTDFAWNKNNMDENCPVLYGHVLDELNNQRVPICGEAGREKILYESDHHQLKVDFSKTEKRFMISATVTGCPDVPAPPGAWVRRQGDHIEFGCKYEDVMWTLDCKDSRWTGVVKNCSTTTEKPTVNIHTTKSPLKIGEARQMQHKRTAFISEKIAVLIVLCVTMILCVIVITTGIVCYRRYKTEALEVTEKRQKPEPVYATYERCPVDGFNDNITQPAGQWIQHSQNKPFNHADLI